MEVFSLLGLASAKSSRVPGKLVERSEEPQELEGQGVELYRKAMGNLIHLGSDRRYFDLCGEGVGQAHAEAGGARR